MERRQAAAVAGVLKYLALRAGGGRVGRGQAAAAVASVPGAAGQGVHASPWALYGRQALMNQRIRMQSRRKA